MQVTETLSEGLKRQFQVAISADNLSQALADEIQDVKGKVNIKGFRPGKVPEAHIRKVYGRSIMSDVIQKKVQESCDTIVKDNDLKVAKQPDVDFGKEEETLESVMNGEAGLNFTVDLEIMPEFDLIDFSTLELTRLTAPVSDDEVEKSLDNIRERSRTFSPAKEGAKAKKGDQVKADFVGMMDGAEFQGGAAEQAMITIGGSGYVPGFDDGLIGASVGDKVVSKLTMPEDYHASELAGKDVEFTFTVHEISTPDADKSMDELATGLGLENEAKLRETINDQVMKSHDDQSRLKLKRALFDTLDEAYDFDVPPSMQDTEFNQIWSQVQREKGVTPTHNHDHDHDHDHSHDHQEETPEEAAEKADYLKIAARRIRLGLIMSRVAQSNEITLNEEETNQALYRFIYQYPGQEQQVIAELKNNQALVSQITAPALEDKVADFVLQLAKVSDKTVDIEELMKPIEE